MTQNNNDNEQEKSYYEEISQSKVTHKSKGLSKSFVWDYFRKDKNGITATCQVILDDGTECGISYNDGSTTSNLINHLALLIKTLKSSLQQFYIESVTTDISELTILDSMEEIIEDTKDFVEIKEVDLTGIVHKKIDILVPMVTVGMLEKVKKVLYDSMHKYWQSVSDIGMLACLLDPRFKKLRFANATIIQKTNEKLRELYESESKTYTAPKYSVSLSNIQNEDLETSRVQKKRKSILLDFYVDNNNKISEIDEYLSLEEEGRRTDPFQWWNIKKTRFPILSKIARKYLCVSATSVSSERLFSDVGNNITAKRTNLNPEL
ncbi:12117_t:CDS:2, partial [Acaulospora morrowiae]